METVLPDTANQAKTHNAVAAAIVQERADWGVAIVTVARQYGLGFLPLQAEQYDFVVPRIVSPERMSSASRSFSGSVGESSLDSSALLLRKIPAIAGR